MTEDARMSHSGYSFADLFDALAGSTQFDELLNRILAISVRELSAHQGSILLLEGDENPQLKMLAAIGLPQEIIQRGYVPRKGSPSEFVLRELKPVIINDDLPAKGPLAALPS